MPDKCLRKAGSTIWQFLNHFRTFREKKNAAPRNFVNRVKENKPEKANLQTSVFLVYYRHQSTWIVARGHELIVNWTEHN